jgi:hypothetical protein
MDSMRLRKSFWNVPAALLAMATSILFTGVAGAVVDADESIDPDSPNYDGSAGYVDASDSSFSTGVDFMCVDIDNDFQIGCDSDHPDKVKLARFVGEVSQKKRGNNASAWMWVGEMGGFDVGGTLFPLDCERVQLKGKLKNRNEKIESECKLTKCELPTSLSEDQYRSAEACIDDAEATGDLGKKVTTLKRDKNNLLGGKIKSKGVWLEND